MKLYLILSLLSLLALPAHHASIVPKQIGEKAPKHQSPSSSEETSPEENCIVDPKTINSLEINFMTKSQSPVSGMSAVNSREVSEEEPKRCLTGIIIAFLFCYVLIAIVLIVVAAIILEKKSKN
jgi:hypothetical protein